jgi:hypothetical protein
MKRRQPPRFAIALLEYFVSDGTLLAGDLIEDFESRQSRGWFWWQVLAAIAMASFNRADDIRPLRLVDLQPADALERSRRMNIRFRPVNLTASPLPGVGGLGLLTLALLVTVVMPAAWLVMLASMLAGIALGIVMIAMQRRRASTETRSS